VRDNLELKLKPEKIKMKHEFKMYQLNLERELESAARGT